MSKISYNVVTEVEGDDIRQTVTSEFDGRVEVISRQLINTREVQLRVALVSLGWKPPQEVKFKFTGSPGLLPKDE